MMAAITCQDAPALGIAAFDVCATMALFLPLFVLESFYFLLLN